MRFIRNEDVSEFKKEHNVLNEILACIEVMQETSVNITELSHDEIEKLIDKWIELLMLSVNTRIKNYPFDGE